MKKQHGRLLKVDLEKQKHGIYFTWHLLHSIFGLLLALFFRLTSWKICRLGHGGPRKFTSNHGTPISDKTFNKQSWILWCCLRSWISIPLHLRFISFLFPFPFHFQKIKSSKFFSFRSKYQGLVNRNLPDLCKSCKFGIGCWWIGNIRICPSDSIVYFEAGPKRLISGEWDKKML